MYNNVNNKNDRNNTKSSRNIITHPYGKSQELNRIVGLEGTLKLLYLLEEAPRRYKDLYIALENLSQTSLSRRLKKLQTLNIIKQKPIRSKRRETHEYIFTIRGEQLMKFFQDYEKEIQYELILQRPWVSFFLSFYCLQIISRRSSPIPSKS